MQSFLPPFICMSTLPEYLSDMINSTVTLLACAFQNKTQFGISVEIFTLFQQNAFILKFPRSLRPLVWGFSEVKCIKKDRIVQQGDADLV